MHRRAGLAGLAQQQEAATRFASKAAQLVEAQIQDLGSQLAIMRLRVFDFCDAHRDDLRRDPALRAGFERLCDVLGVDPFLGADDATSSSPTSSFQGIRLGSATQPFDLAKRLVSAAFSRKNNNDTRGLTTATANGDGDDNLPILAQVIVDSALQQQQQRQKPREFYEKLSVRIMELALASRDRNGGLIPLSTLVNDLNRLRIGAYSGANNSLLTGPNAVTEPDAIIATNEFKVLKSGIRIVEIGEELFLQSVPKILNSDTDVLLKLASEMIDHNGEDQQKTRSCCLSLAAACSVTKWEEYRCQGAIDELVRDGTLWVDSQAPDGVTYYWIIALFFA